MEETFDRLLERPSYAILRSFLRAYFESKSAALAAICEDPSFTAMLQRSRAILLKQDDIVADEQLMCRHGATWGMAFAPVKFDVYQGRKIRLSDGGEKVFAHAYSSFRQSLFEERRRHRRRPWGDDSWP
jgi:hypothetical protein